VNRGVVFLGVAPVALVPLAFVGTSNQQVEGTYPVDVAEARDRLLHIGPPSFLFGQSDPDVEAERVSDSEIAWIVRMRGTELMRYVAQLSPAGERSTHVTLTLRGATQGRFGNVEQRLSQNGTIRDLHLAAMQERVASRLERRQFELRRLYPAMARATAANMTLISDQMERAGEQAQRRDRQNIEKAYRREAAGIRQ
jgi:hypothetical protein